MACSNNLCFLFVSQQFSLLSYFLQLCIVSSRLVIAVSSIIVVTLTVCLFFCSAPSLFLSSSSFSAFSWAWYVVWADRTDLFNSFVIPSFSGWRLTWSENLTAFTVCRPVIFHSPSAGLSLVTTCAFMDRLLSDSAFVWANTTPHLITKGRHWYQLLPSIDLRRNRPAFQKWSTH